MLKSIYPLLTLVLILLVAVIWSRFEVRRQIATRDQAIAASAYEVGMLRNHLARADSARQTTLVGWTQRVQQAASDSLAAWLHAHARRRLPPHLDSVLVHDTDTVCVSADDVRRSLIHDSLGTDERDSLRGVIKLDSARIDSVSRGCVPPTTPWKALGIAVGAGYIAGLLTCIAR